MAEIKVVITDETGGQTSTSVPTPSEQIPTPTQNANSKGDVKTKAESETKSNSKGLAIASMIGSSSFNYVTSNIGKYTGDSKKQQTANGLMQLGSIAAVAYVNPYLAAAQVAIQIGTTALDNYYEQKWDKASSQARLAKAGYNNSGEVVGRRH